MSNTHKWCAEGVDQQIEELQNVPIKPFSWSINKLKKGEILNIDKVKDLPPEASAEKEEFLRENIKALIFLPVKIGEEVGGFIGFDNVRAPEKWSEEDLNLLKLSSDIIGNALKRKETEQELEELNRKLKNRVKRRTKELEESEEKYRRIAEESHLAICILQDDVIKYANQNIADIYEYTIEEILNWKPGEFVKIFAQDSLDFVLVQAKRKQAGDTDIITHYPIHCIKKSGELFWVDNISTTIIYNGKPADLITLIDITERKQVDEKLKESEEKYRKAYFQANLYRDIFAHDLNNILQNINSSVELSSLYLNNPDKLHTIRELNEIINEQVNRGKKLINNVRKITEIDESEIHLEKTEINRVLNRAIDFLKNSFQTRALNIQVNAPDKRIYVKANDLLLDVFENILINAVRYNDRSKIEISVDISKEQEEDKDYVKMEFKDNGIGISDYRKNSIFEKGIRKGQRSKGLGLGLSLVKKIIDSYQGKIWVEDRKKGDYKQGSNFVVLLHTAI